MHCTKSMQEVQGHLFGLVWGPSAPPLRDLRECAVGSVDSVSSAHVGQNRSRFCLETARLLEPCRKALPHCPAPCFLSGFNHSLKEVLCSPYLALNRRTSEVPVPCCPAFWILITRFQDIRRQKSWDIHAGRPLSWPLPALAARCRPRRSTSPRNHSKSTSSSHAATHTYYNQGSSLSFWPCRTTPHRQSAT